MGRWECEGVDRACASKSLRTFSTHIRGALPLVVLRTEVIDWWESERFRVHQACLEAHAKYLESATQAAQKLTLKALLLPRSTATRAIECQLQSDVKMLNVELTASLQDSFQALVMQIEGNASYEGASVTETATLALGGALALGSLGLAATAASFATSTATLVFFVPVTTFSWPLFAVAGAGATAVAFLSPKAIDKARSMMVHRFVRHLDTTLRLMLLDESPSRHSTWATLRDQIDKAAISRLESIQ